MGAKRIDIFYQFLTESISLCLCGTILGIAGGWLFAHGMARVAVRILPIVEMWPVVLSVRWIVISVLFSIFMGITFGVYPAIRASRMTDEQIHKEPSRLMPLRMKLVRFDSLYKEQYMERTVINHIP